MKVTAKVKAVAKFKQQFNSTGILLALDIGDTWVDMPGQLNYKDYKDKTFDFNIEQNEKGYWHGTLANTFTPQTHEVAPQSSKPEGGVNIQEIRMSAIASACKCVCVNDLKGATVVLDVAELFVNYIQQGLSTSISDLPAREGDYI